MSERTLDGAVALVTGAGPGIGRSCALALADDGADVVVAARRPEVLDELAREIAEIDWDDYLASVQVNVIGTMEICRTAARHMAEQGGGSIVNFSALSATTLMADMARYTSTKGATESMSKTMAKEMGSAGVRVNIVTPGMTSGPPLDAMFERTAVAQSRTPEEVGARFAAGAALRRHVDPDDIAEAVRFLASPRASNITGQELQVTAGQHIV